MSAYETFKTMRERAQHIANENCGLALKLAQKQTGITFDTSKDVPSWDEERDAMYDDLYREIERRCR